MPITFYIGVIVSVLAMTSGWIHYKYLSDGFKILFYFTCFAAATEVTVNITLQLGSTETTPAAHFYILIEFLFFALFYNKQLNGFIKKQIVFFVIVAFELFCVVNILFIQNLHEYPNFTRALNALIIALFSIVYFYKVMAESNIKKLGKEPMIWVNTIVLIYFSGSFFFYILFNVILEFSREFSKLTNFIFSMLNMVFYLIIAFAFYKSKRNKIIQ